MVQQNIVIIKLCEMAVIYVLLLRPFTRLMQMNRTFFSAPSIACFGGILGGKSPRQCGTQEQCNTGRNLQCIFITQVQIYYVILCHLWYITMLPCLMYKAKHATSDFFSF